MSRLLYILFFVGLMPALTEAQSVTGTFTDLANREVRLHGFQGFESVQISSTRADANGTFTLAYGSGYRGMGILSTSDEESFLVVLSGEVIELKGESFAFQESIRIVAGPENQLFDRFASEHPRREQALSAWFFLRNIYRSDSLFAVQPVPVLAIDEEIERIREEEATFLAELDPSAYIKWYLPVRRLVSSVPAVAQQRTDEIPATIEGFRQLDYTDVRLHHSGLLSDIIESHVWLIENSGRTLDRVFEELNQSSELLVAQLANEPALLNSIGEYLFDVLERRSLFTSSEHLAIHLLENHSDAIGRRLTNKLEVYRAMRIGNKAPEIIFTEHTVRPSGSDAGKLSEVDTDYVLVLFAAGWCPHCRQMMPDLLSAYPEWREQGVEVVMVSLDDTPDGFRRFTSEIPFFATTDFGRWNSEFARDYHVFSVPSMFLLDGSGEIVIRPNSVRHMSAWVDWYLVQGN